MILTNADLNALRVYHGNAIEYQDAQRKLFAEGLHWCPRCDSTLPTAAFHKSPKRGFGLASACKLCKKKRGSRSYVKLSDATRRARFTARQPEKATPGTKGAYEKTRAAREAGIYIYDPLQPYLSLPGH